MCDKNNHLQFEEDEYLYHVDTVLLGFLDPENKSSRYEDLIRSKHIAPQNLSSITGGHGCYRYNFNFVIIGIVDHENLLVDTKIVDRWRPFCFLLIEKNPQGCHIGTRLILVQDSLKVMNL